MTRLVRRAGLVVLLCGAAYLYRIARFCRDGCEWPTVAVDAACRELDVWASEHCGQVVVLKRQPKLPLFSAFGDEFGARRRRLLTKEQELVAQRREYNKELLAAARREEVEHFNQCSRLGRLANACPNRESITLESLDCLNSTVLVGFPFPSGSNLEQMRQLLLGHDAVVAPSSLLPFALSRYPVHGDNHSNAQAGECFYAPDQVWAQQFAGGAMTRIMHSHATIRCFPSLLIIGVQKGSTTELRRALLRGNRGSVRAVAPHKLESHILENNATQIAERYLTQSALSPSHFLRLQVLLDKTPSYFHDPNARLDYFDHIHMVLLLRDPAARMYSAYWNLCLIKYQSAGNCSNAKLERAVLSGNFTDRDVRHTVEVGHYATHLVRIARLFNSTRKTAKLFVSFADDFQRDGAGYFARLSTFLGLPRALRYLGDSNATAHKALRFNSLRATGYARPDPETLNRVRREVYRDSLDELRTLLLTSQSMLFANPNFTVVVDHAPSWLTSATPH